MSILENAKYSLIMGLEDYSSEAPGRYISCVRNLYAGILLLLKHKLVLLSPPDSNESLIKSCVVPILNHSGKLVWVGRGKKTVNYQEIKGRLTEIGIEIEWERLDKIRDLRNNIEHYYSKQEKDAIREMISNIFIIVRNFLSTHLEMDSKEFLGDYAWDALVSISEVYDAEKQECIAILEGLDLGSEALLSALYSWNCDCCGSGLIAARNNPSDESENIIYCKSCENTWEFEKIAEAALEDYFSFESYLSMTDGNDVSLIQCPECLRTSYVIFEEKCALCGERMEHTCGRCGMPIPPEELNGSGYCSWCDKMMSNDD